MVAAIVFTVALLVITAYFLLGGLPLLILKHDVPVDARFIRGFFTVYYRVAFWASVGALIGYAKWGKYPFALGAALFAGITTILRRHLVRAMARLGERIEASEPEAIKNFRRVHAAALAINVFQLIVIVWGIVQLSNEITPR